MIKISQGEDQVFKLKKPVLTPGAINPSIYIETNCSLSSEIVSVSLNLMITVLFHLLFQLRTFQDLIFADLLQINYERTINRMIAR